MTSVATQRFDGIASNFATSEVHSRSPSIERMLKYISLASRGALIDVACGAGHLALSFAGRGNRIVGLDGAPSMLEALRALADQRGARVETVLAMSHEIPFPTGTFDAAVSRLAPHHFPDLFASIREMARVVRPGGLVGIIDLHGYEDADVDAFNHQLELLHDPTHVRSHTPRTWRAALTEAGLEVVAIEPYQRESPRGITVRRWCEIAASGYRAEQMIVDRLESAPQPILAALGISRDPSGGGDYLIPVRTLLAVARKSRWS